VFEARHPLCQHGGVVRGQRGGQPVPVLPAGLVQRARGVWGPLRAPSSSCATDPSAPCSTSQVHRRAACPFSGPVLLSFLQCREAKHPTSPPLLFYLRPLPPHSHLASPDPVWIWNVMDSLPSSCASAAAVGKEPGSTGTPILYNAGDSTVPPPPVLQLLLSEKNLIVREEAVRERAPLRGLLGGVPRHALHAAPLPGQGHALPQLVSPTARPHPRTKRGQTGLE